MRKRFFTYQRQARVMALTSLIGGFLSCDHGQRLAELEAWRKDHIASQEKIDDAQNVKVDGAIDMISTLECPNPDVREFIRGCTNDLVCDEGKVVSSIIKMKNMPHVMVRIPYSADAALSIKAEDRLAQIYKLFIQHQKFTILTKLLVVAIQPLHKKSGNKKHSPNHTDKTVIDSTKLLTQAYKFRNSLYEPDYNLPRGIHPLAPQVPRCDPRTEGLVQIFHKANPLDQLTAQERAIPAPYVDLIIFLVEC